MNQFLRLTNTLALLLFLLSGVIRAQESKPPAPPAPVADDKAEQIVKRGLETVGGDAYLNVRTLIGRGFFTSYQEGVSQVPAKFVDYLSYPDKERTEFVGGGTEGLVEAEV